jgi:hypothetical protein
VDSNCVDGENMKRLLFLCMLLPSLAALADLQKSDTKESLRGLNGVFVISQLIDFQPEGLSTNDIQKTVEAALHDAGIQTDAKPQNAHGDANLSITVNTVRDAQLGLYLFMVQVTVIQRVQLTREVHAQSIAAQTWTRNIQGFTSPDRIDVIEQAVKNCIGMFVDDYWKVNPRPKE